MLHNFVGQKLEQDWACKDDSTVDVDKNQLVVFIWQMGWFSESKTIVLVSDTWTGMTERLGSAGAVNQTAHVWLL